MNILSSIARQLTALYPEGEARAMARCVVEDAVRLSPTDVLRGKDSELSADDKARLQNIVVRLLTGEPLQYVLGKATFCGREFGVRPGCLIPRPETEDLVQYVLSDCRSQSETIALDIGTGSGCIAITLSLAQGFRVTAWDVSCKALHIAEENGKRLGGGVRFERRDILNVGDEPRQWDVIVSNPPYVCLSEAEGMERNVLDHEPRLALFVPDDDALRFHRAIARFALSHLTVGGRLYMELNPRFARECALLLQSHGFVGVSVMQDRFGKDRFTKCQLP